ncbi:MAG: hypothetical protein AB1757_05970 [Acidobacteriota bacterium]
MLKKWDLNKEAGSLEMLITAISTDLVKEKNVTAQGTSREKVVREMEEALCELRQARGMTKFLLYTLEHHRLSRRINKRTSH